MGTTKAKEVIVESKDARLKKWTRSFGMWEFDTPSEAIALIERQGFTPNPTRCSWSLRPEYDWRVRQGKAVRARWSEGKRVTAKGSGQ